MVHQKFASEDLFAKMQQSKYMRYVCAPLADGRAEQGDMIVFLETDKGGNQTGRLTVAIVQSAEPAASEHGPRVVFELGLCHMRGDSL